MANNVSTSNPENNSSLKHDEVNNDSIHEEKRVNIKPITDKDLEKSILKGRESPNAKNATAKEKELAKMHWGFITAIDNYFFISRDPEQLAKTLRDAGFSHDWPMCIRQTAIARLAIKKKLRIFGESGDSVLSRTQPFLNTIIAAYYSVVNWNS